MRYLALSAILAAGLLFAPVGHAQTSPVTATCKDGTTYSGATRSGACRGHKGVASWDTAAPATPGAAAPVPSKTSEKPASESGSSGKAAAAGGGPGKVWVNTATKIYHCPGDRYYGKTKAGEYMTQSAAQAAGDRPAGGKACTP